MDFKRATELAPEDANYAYGYGVHLFSLKDYRHSIKYLEQAVSGRIDAGMRSHARACLAEAYRRAGRSREVTQQMARELAESMLPA